MSGSTFGTVFQLTTFGESHGPAIGGIIQGCPAGIELDFEFIRKEMQRRKPGQSSIVTQRKEDVFKLAQEIQLDEIIGLTGTGLTGVTGLLIIG